MAAIPETSYEVISRDNKMPNFDQLLALIVECTADISKQLSKLCAARGWEYFTFLYNLPVADSITDSEIYALTEGKISSKKSFFTNKVLFHDELTRAAAAAAAAHTNSQPIFHSDTSSLLVTIYKEYRSYLEVFVSRFEMFQDNTCPWFNQDCRWPALTDSKLGCGPWFPFSKAREVIVYAKRPSVTLNAKCCNVFVAALRSFIDQLGRAPKTAVIKNVSSLVTQFHAFLVSFVSRSEKDAAEGAVTATEFGTLIKLFMQPNHVVTLGLWEGIFSKYAGLVFFRYFPSMRHMSQVPIPGTQSIPEWRSVQWTFQSDGLKKLILPRKTDLNVSELQCFYEAWGFRELMLEEYAKTKFPKFLPETEKAEDTDKIQAMLERNSVLEKTYLVSRYQAFKASRLHAVFSASFEITCSLFLGYGPAEKPLAIEQFTRFFMLDFAFRSEERAAAKPPNNASAAVRFPYLLRFIIMCPYVPLADVQLGIQKMFEKYVNGVNCIGLGPKMGNRSRKRSIRGF